MLAGLPTAALARCQRVSAAMVPNRGRAPPHFRNVRRSSIDRLQSFDDVLSAMFVTGAGPVARAIQVDADPSFVIDLLQNAVASGEINVAIAEVVDAFEEFGLGG